MLNSCKLQSWRGSEVASAHLINRLRRFKLPRLYQHELVVIHVGKCAGATVRQELRLADIAHSEVHVSRPIYFPGKRYLILLRNPVDRFVSAFNWRYRIVMQDQSASNPARARLQRAVFDRYPTVEHAALALFCSNGSANAKAWQDLERISHVQKNIAFYLRRFLNVCDPGCLHGVVCVETINEDMRRLFGIDVTRYEHRNSPAVPAVQLTDQARANLLRYLRPDYQCIERLAALRLIPQSSLESLLV
jgi:hypothetical protein